MQWHGHGQPTIIFVSDQQEVCLIRWI
jgi:hypothetical protein